MEENEDVVDVVVVTGSINSANKTGITLPICNVYFSPRATKIMIAIFCIICLCGLLDTLNAFMVVYGSPPSRTLPSLQAILRTLRIPYTVLLSYMILHKRPSLGRLICTCGTLIGLFISFEPIIFDINGQYRKKGIASVIWPLVFGLAYLPSSLSNVLQERYIKKDAKEETLVFLAWIQTYKLIFVGLFFWTEFIPGFGTAKSFKEFQDGMYCGFMAQYTGNSNVHYPWAAGASSAFILFFTGVQLFSLLLIRYTDGANYLVIIQAPVTPLVAFFWTLFSSKNGIHWHPHFTLSTGFIIASVLVIVPCVLLYNYFSILDDKKRAAREAALNKYNDDMRTLTDSSVPS
ncbi:uncharacterized protein TRIADDRAFT_57459 [Trichoplax adhaerens]|uniref:EamA domain-containing protein n=1 Tax=Trichoplax adhaerens TaxID=10228 RepID=B3RZH9_TRIAD|nr:hypothetical protein TRIADDRAFT_57459 [Trichoplax adhaerens]EDV24210.1 hypothetical protein TRIADDRAFT_57459 [Trichoplax adhaerens]|eukprot:XP_002113736.1 hypothetical protein TRIADDRAFT_57459 [Trichoplax adhaerens]